MKTLFNIAKYTLAGYGLLVLISNLQKVAAKSSGEKPEESYIPEPKLRDVKLYGVNDSATLSIYSLINDRMNKNGRVTYSDVNEILEVNKMPEIIDYSDSIGWDEENFKPIAEYDKEIGCVVIYLPKAKKFA